MKGNGVVHLVGVDPGSPDLLTLRGQELLRHADAVLCDSSLSLELLSGLLPHAERIQSSKAATSPDLRQLAIERARAGRSVVWLLPGDPSSSRRGLAEAGRLDAAGVAFDVVPGVVDHGEPERGPTVLCGRPDAGWRKRHPLFGQRVVVTRSREQAAEFSEALRRQGAEVLEIPVIRITLPHEHEPLIEALTGLNSYDFIVFTSANGVTAFFDHLFKAFHDLRDLGGTRIAAVGPATARKLNELHLQVDVMPQQYVGKAIVEAMRKFESLENLRILLPRAEEANSDLPKLLEDQGAIVDDIPCYRTVPDVVDPECLGVRLRKEGAEWVTFTSGSTVRAFHHRFDLPVLLQAHEKMRVASIGPETTQVLRSLGVRRLVEANPHTTEGIIRVLTDARGSAK